MKKKPPEGELSKIIESHTDLLELRFSLICTSNQADATEEHDFHPTICTSTLIHKAIKAVDAEHAEVDEEET